MGDDLIEKAERPEKKIPSNLNQQAKFIAALVRDNSQLLGESSVNLEPEEKQRFLEDLRIGRITQKQISQTLRQIKTLVFYEVDQTNPVFLFEQIKWNQEGQAFIKQVLKSEANEQLNAQDLGLFLKKLPDITAFERRIEKFAASPEEKEALDKLAKTLYGKQWEYFQQVGLLQEEGKEESIENLQEEINKVKLNSLAEVKRAKSVNEKAFSEAWTATLNRILTETTFLKDMLEFIKLEDLKNGFLNNKRIKWRTDLRTGGINDPLFNTIEFSFMRPEPEDLWSSLAERGEFPWAAQAVWHEEIHLAQTLRPNGLYRLHGILLPQELSEGQAYRTANLTIATKTVDQVIQFLLTFKNPKLNSLHYKGMKKNRLEYAVRAVDKLKALGVSDHEIGRIFAGIKLWRNEMYPSIEWQIDKQMAQQEINKEHLDVLIEQDRVKRKMQMFKAQFIARSELAKICKLLN